MSEAEIAYEAYRRHAPVVEDEAGEPVHAFQGPGGAVEVVIGHRLPPFSQLPPSIQNAWGSVVDALRKPVERVDRF